MKKYQPILAIVAIAIIALMAIQSLRPSVQPNDPDVKRIQIKESASWAEICSVFNELFGEGTMKIYINDLFYEYHCAHCVGIGFQGSDPLEINPLDLQPLYEWCKKNQGKYPELSFGADVKFPVVKEIFTILNEHEFIFYMNRPSNDFTGIKIDLLDGRPQIKTKLNQTNTPCQLSNQSMESG